MKNNYQKNKANIAASKLEIKEAKKGGEWFRNQSRCKKFVFKHFGCNHHNIALILDESKYQRKEQKKFEVQTRYVFLEICTICGKHVRTNKRYY